MKVAKGKTLYVGGKRVKAGGDVPKNIADKLEAVKKPKPPKPPRP